MAQETGLRQTLIDYVEDARQTGLDLREAAVSALERVIAEGQAAEVLRVFGATLLLNLWRTDQTMHRSDVFNGHTWAEPHTSRAVDQPAAVAVLEREGGHASIDAHTTAAPVSLADALLDLPFHVSPRVWKPLRDLTGAECEALCHDYHVRASVNTERSRLFKSLSGALKPDETVGTLPRERVARFWQEAQGKNKEQGE